MSLGWGSSLEERVTTTSFSTRGLRQGSLPPRCLGSSDQQVAGDGGGGRRQPSRLVSSLLVETGGARDSALVVARTDDGLVLSLPSGAIADASFEAAEDEGYADISVPRAVADVPVAEEPIAVDLVDFALDDLGPLLERFFTSRSAATLGFHMEQCTLVGAAWPDGFDLM